MRAMKPTTIADARNRADICAIHHPPAATPHIMIDEAEREEEEHDLPHRRQRGVPDDERGFRKRSRLLAAMSATSD